MRSVANSRIPIITGIGHEIDENLCDLVADFAASTPSNVAQILTSDKADEIRSLCSRILRTKETILLKINDLKTENHKKINEIKHISLNKIFEQNREIEAKKRILESNNPQNILSKGYAFVGGDFEIGGEIIVQTIDKKITAEVKNVEQN